MEKGDMKESQPNSRCQTPEPLESFMSAGLVESTADNADSKILGGMCKESSKEPREAIPSKALPTRRRKRSDTRSDVAQQRANVVVTISPAVRSPSRTASSGPPPTPLVAFASEVC